MTLKKLIVSLETSERPYQPITFLYGKLLFNNRIDNHTNDYQRNKEEVTI